VGDGMSWRAQGLRAWLLQRLTAVYMIVYLLLAAIILYRHIPLDYGSWLGLFRQPVINIATIFLFGSVFFHAWIGVRDILVDYVRPQPVRFAALTIVSLLVMGLMTWITFLMFGVLQR
jgi:succinate dehydrogenase / fumarate reductase membrane anchor subunit